MGGVMARVVARLARVVAGLARVVAGLARVVGMARCPCVAGVVAGLARIVGMARRPCVTLLVAPAVTAGLVWPAVAAGLVGPAMARAMGCSGVVKQMVAISNFVFVVCPCSPSRDSDRVYLRIRAAASVIKYCSYTVSRMVMSLINRTVSVSSHPSRSSIGRPRRITPNMHVVRERPRTGIRKSHIQPIVISVMFTLFSRPMIHFQMYPCCDDISI
jgi:hypothetical protein